MLGRLRVAIVAAVALSAAAACGAAPSRVEAGASSASDAPTASQAPPPATAQPQVQRLSALGGKPIDDKVMDAVAPTRKGTTKVRTFDGSKTLIQAASYRIYALSDADGPYRLAVRDLDGGGAVAYASARGAKTARVVEVGTAGDIEKNETVPLTNNTMTYNSDSPSTAPPPFPSSSPTAAGSATASPSARTRAVLQQLTVRCYEDLTPPSPVSSAYGPLIHGFQFIECDVPSIITTILAERNLLTGSQYTHGAQGGTWGTVWAMDVLGPCGAIYGGSFPWRTSSLTYFQVPGYPGTSNIASGVSDWWNSYCHGF